MSIAVRLTAEERFTATQKKVKQALTESELVNQEKADRTFRLRTLRLAKEAEDKDAEDKAAPRRKTVARTAKKNPSRPPTYRLGRQQLSAR